MNSRVAKFGVIFQSIPLLRKATPAPSTCTPTTTTTPRGTTIHPLSPTTTTSSSKPSKKKTTFYSSFKTSSKMWGPPSWSETFLTSTPSKNSLKKLITNCPILITSYTFLVISRISATLATDSSTSSTQSSCWSFTTSLMARSGCALKVKK